MPAKQLTGAANGYDEDDAASPVIDGATGEAEEDVLGAWRNKQNAVILRPPAQVIQRPPIQLVDILEWLPTAPYQDRRRILEYELIKSHNADRVIDEIKQLAIALGLDRGDPTLNRFAPGMMDECDIIPTGELPMIWEFGLYERALHMCNGMSGAGKSSVWYNIALHLAAGRDLWGLKTFRQEKIFYLDPENPTARPYKLERITKWNELERGRNVTFHDGEGADLSQPGTIRELGDIMLHGKYTGLIIDPIVEIFGTQNENDNAEASRHMKLLRELTKRTGVWCVFIHHMNKTGEGGGRGAGAREGAARVIWDLMIPDIPGEKDDEYKPNDKKYRGEPVRFYARKDGIGGLKSSVYLKMQGDKGEDGRDNFERVPFVVYASALKEGGNKGESAVDKATRVMVDFFTNRDEVILYAEAKQHGMDAEFGETTVRDALENMCKPPNPTITGSGLLRKVKVNIAGKTGKPAAGYHRAELNLSDLQGKVPGHTYTAIAASFEVSATEDGAKTTILKADQDEE